MSHGRAERWLRVIQWVILAKLNPAPPGASWLKYANNRNQLWTSLSPLSSQSVSVLYFTHSAPPSPITPATPVTSEWSWLTRSEPCCPVIISHNVSGGRGGDIAWGAWGSYQSNPLIILPTRCQPTFVIHITSITITTIFHHHFPSQITLSDHFLSHARWTANILFPYLFLVV